MSDNINKIGDLLSQKPRKKAPAYEWQDLALHVIEELGIPNFKRNSVFKVCKTEKKNFVLQALNDTKELCKKGEQWKYFFKVIEDKNTSQKEV